MSVSAKKNIGAFLHAAFAAPATSVTAGGAGDATEVQGSAIDRFAQSLPLSASVLYSIKAAIANGQTMSLAYKVQHSDDGSTNWLDYAVVANGVVVTGNGAAQTLVIKQDVDLSGAKRYVRVDFTPDCSAANTDTATLSPVFVFGGMEELP